MALEIISDAWGFFYTISRAILHSHCIQTCPKIFFIQKPTKVFSGISVSKGRVSLVIPMLWTTIFQSYTFLCMAALTSYFWRAHAVSMRRDADSLRVKCHLNSLLPFMESICRRDFSAQKVRRQTEISERWKAVYSEHIFSSLLIIDAHGEIWRTIEEE